jgi:hypothetical protein
VKLALGDRVWGETGVRCEVLGFAPTSHVIAIKVRCPKGDRFITPDQIRGVEPPRLISVGDQVRLKGTKRTYAVLALRQVKSGIRDGEFEFETWATLRPRRGGTVHWKVCQLEPWHGSKGLSAKLS